jgi:Uma2 family endonuclease
MAEPAARGSLTAEEYLAFERSAAERHEFAEGEVFAMAGGSREHSLIALNVGSELRAALRRKPCEVFNSDLRLKVESANRYTYADLTVACGTPRFEDPRRDTLLNPIAIVEVLPDSTESYDRGEKFALYRTIDSFQEYLLISQKQVQVEHFLRQADGSWLLRVFGAGEQVPLPSLGCELSVDEIYFRVFE